MLLRLTGTETVETLVADESRLLVEVRWDGAHRRPPKHLHPGHDEHFEVRAGRIAVVLGRAERVYEAGQEFDAPRGTVHAMWPVDGPAVATWECRPPRRVLEMFSAMDELTQRGLTGLRHELAMGAVVGRYDDVFRLAARPRPVARAGLRLLSRFAS